MLRFKLIGLGNRGLNTLKRFQDIPQDLAVFTQLEDISPVSVEAARSLCPYTISNEPYDAAYICTDWASHASIAIAEMESGHDVVVEVPAAVTLEECQALCQTSQRTGRRCLMAENCCFDAFHLACLEIARQGLFGTLTHLEGAYIHTIGMGDDATKPWMIAALRSTAGNSYPTHAYGPIAQLLALDGDSFTVVKSLSSTLTTGLNTALLRTKRGRSVLLQLDVSTPRPYSRMQTICGTEGFAQKYPVPTLHLRGMSAPLIGDEALTLARKYMTSPAALLWLEGERRGVSNPMNYAMDRSIIHCLTTGERFAAEVEEAAEWSSLVALTGAEQLN